MVRNKKNSDPGLAFAEGIFRGKGGGRNFPKENSSRGMRNSFLLIFIAIAAVLILVKLASIQIINGSYYRNLSNNNRIKTIVVHAPRGTIFDRNGKPLTFNVPGFRETINGKTKLLEKDEALTNIANGNKNLEIDSLRNYPYGEVTSHLLGYIGQISLDDLKLPEFSNYNPGDLIGKMGIEAQYQSNLVGTDGKELVEVDSLGKQTRKLGATDPIPGDDIHLTIDADLQKKAYEAMSGVKKGALIISTPKGEILSLISKPSFDPNLFTLGENYKVATSSGYQNIEEILTDGNGQPLLNRVIGGVYPPGSTFKLVVAAAGLQDKIIDENYQVEDTGILKVGDFSFANWYYTGYGGRDGEVNVVKGIKRSNDIFFYKLAEKVGVDKVSAMAKKFEMGKALGIDLPGEVDGLVPTPEWKQKAIGEQWYLGDTYHYGIGQGYLLATPIQVNSFTQVIANGGVLYKPYLNMANGDKKIADNIINSDTTSLIREGMIEACQAGGVAWPIFNYSIKNPNLKIDGKNITEAASKSADFRHVVVACKTGTAQHGDENTLPHAWITLFAPAYNPQIVVTVLAEDSGEGSNIAGPIAKKILDAYFGNLK